MSEQIREQVSAFLDGELPNSETELLLKRLMRDVELRDSFARYALIGESLRGGGGFGVGASAVGFAARVNRAIDGEPGSLPERAPNVRVQQRWWKPFAGVAVAAGVATIAVVGFQQRSAAPTLSAAVERKEPLSYTVPVVAAEKPTAMPAARLTSYVFAHSRYSSVLGQDNVLSALLTDGDEQDAGVKDASVAP